jgi:GR25 family glycosyltransferase involved in LPS biosynthesis
MIKAVCITIKDNKISENGYNRLIESSKQVGNDFDILKWDAITPDNVDYFMSNAGLTWNYPWTGSHEDPATGLIKSAYTTANQKARIACACSHYCLWSESAVKNITMLIMEHDAMFIKKLDFDPEDTSATIIGINSPLGATRKANVFHKIVQETQTKFQLTPVIDNDKIPQGLAGNSAYVIKPEGAKKLLDLVNKYGMWPNDAIMCRQLISKLGVTKDYYTKVQGLQSTTST